MLWCSVGFRNAGLLVVRPVCSLAVSAAVEDETASRAGPKSGRNLATLGRGTFAANLAFWVRVLLVLHLSWHCAAWGPEALSGVLSKSFPKIRNVFNPNMQSNTL